jgi:hypothetical protein
VGAPRCGTTFLGDILRRHPALAYLQEPRLTWRYGNDHKSDRLSRQDARPDVCRHIRRSFAAAVHAAGRTRLLEKTPSNALRLAFVDQVFPDCQFIHLMRHGIESVLSIRSYWDQHAAGIKPDKMAQRLRELHWRQLPYYVKEFARRAMPKPLTGLAGQPVWGPRIPGIDGLLRDLDVLEVCALQWRMCVEAACQFGRRLPADRYLECRLEDFSADQLRTILRFCNLDDADEVWQAFQQQFNPELRAGRACQADPHDIDTIRQWIEPTLRWLGYEP